MLNPIVFTERVGSDFLSYQRAAYPFSDPRQSAQLRRLLNLDQTCRARTLNPPNEPEGAQRGVEVLRESAPYGEGKSQIELL